MRREGFYAFFFPATIPDRGSAARAVVAGVIASGMLAIVLGIPGLVWLLRSRGNSQLGVTLTAASLILVAVTIGTWKEVLSAPIIGILFGLYVIVWSLSHHQIAAAILLAVPLVGGFWTATRGILALRRLPGSSNRSRSA